MANCPTCKIPLRTIQQREGLYFHCSQCNGRAVTVPQIRRLFGDSLGSGLMRQMTTASRISSRACPFCLGQMKMFQLSEPPIALDSCKPCAAIWFDAGKFEALPQGILEAPDVDVLILGEVEAAKKQGLERQGALPPGEAPDEKWKWIPAFFGLPVKIGNTETVRLPWMTWSLSAIIAIVSICAFFDLDNAVHNFGLVPAEVWRYGGATLLTSFFLHAGTWHLVGNLYFFLLFGGDVENQLGRWRFLGLILLSTIVSEFFDIVWNMHSMLPYIGASGGISGVLAFFALQFPRARLAFLFWFLFLLRFGWLHIPASVALILWLLMQLWGALEQIAGLSHVASLAHLGGAMTGFVLWFWWRKLET